MRRWLLPLAAFGLVALGVIALLAVLQPAPAPTREDQAAQLAGELRCPDCQGLSVAESHTAAADAIRAEIARQLAAGRSAEEVRQHFVDRYGQWILLEPADPLVWLLPLGVVAAGIGLFAWWLRGERAAAPPPPGGEPGQPVDDEARRAVREELEALDG
ncbi:MAG TPA: cytochrome c-type biogenesis protein CcmH [Candidatus Limnocylindria bacterium]|nr:cytochrome c-type biogenesis protein CcmH [Candidatus Limnocylindria bacterium]